MLREVLSGSVVLFTYTLGIRQEDVKVTSRISLRLYLKVDKMWDWTWWRERAVSPSTPEQGEL